MKIFDCVYLVRKIPQSSLLHNEHAWEKEREGAKKAKTEDIHLVSVIVQGRPRYPEMGNYW